ncbi:amino acid transporter, putative [Trypanosoma brucei gambiense DAL972]|uniref:Amino acid transporter, putative n=1 Tax=Trypanosoma brucei gambiense (strain MHOM/CI/86/DAL972) TaxID=679716 RepID=C9ZN51_TRYB9|nr:amino acid transporter, putative [Trypanosoma brucei gambiense DAL972]CBH10705.1 amino acid transporter, putative [Trypanosoma brucei gambiense DAL972]|eukprot:XP_011772993.1 amino acid transporter, putative [Trypanosoma brucei gambiense DAL972]
MTEGLGEDKSAISHEPTAFEQRVHDEALERSRRVAKRRNPDNAFMKALHKIIPYGGIVSSSFNLASTTVGAGIVALPVAFQMSGIVMSTIYLIVVAIMVVYSFALLTSVGEHTGLRSYEQLTRTLLGRGADYMAALCMWSLCFGGEVSYVISIRDAIETFVKSSDATSEGLRSESSIRLLTVAIWFFFMLPLCLPKEINSLRVLSASAIVFVLFFVICIIINSGHFLAVNGMRDDIIYFQSGNASINGLGIFLFVYVSQVNCFEVYEEMYKPSVRRMTVSAMAGALMSFCLYFLAGLFGYLQFGSEVNSSILKMYNPLTDVKMGVAYVGIMFKICVGYGLHMFPCRDAVYHVIGISVHTVAWWKNALFCCAMAVASLIAGLFIPDIRMVFGLVGGLSGGFIGYVFPSLMFMYAGGFSVAGVGWGHYLGAYALLFAGVIAITFGTVTAVYDVIV